MSNNFEIYINIPVTSEQEDDVLSQVDQDDVDGVIMFWNTGFSIFVEDFPESRDREEYLEWLRRQITEYFDVDFDMVVDPIGDDL